MTQPADRLTGSLEIIIPALILRLRSELAPMLPWEYRVTLATVGTPIMVACVPVDPVACPFGPLVIPMGKSASGSPCVPVVGATCVVRFLDGNPAKPVIDAVDPLTPTPLPPPVYLPAPPSNALTLASALTTFAAQLAIAVPTGATPCANLEAALAFLL